MKRGVSILISWVLLVGFAVTLALLVTVWVKQTAEEAAKELEETAEQEARCSAVAINANMTCATSNDMTISNRGTFTITKVRFRQLEKVYDEDKILDPGKPETQPLNSMFDISKPIEIIPIIQIEGKEVVCATRKITFTC